MEKLNTYFDFIRCEHDQCSELALTGKTTCWKHLVSQPDYINHIIKSIADGVSLSRWVLQGIDLTNANLPKADLSYACLIGAKLDGVNLQQANLHRAHLDSASLINANLTEANLEFAILGRADLSNAMLDGANLKRSNLVGAIACGASCRRAQFFYSRPGNADFSEVDFSGADITRAIFRRAKLVNSNLAEAVGTANFDRADLTGAKQ
jgi:uncharacterized protein YjbI with pentapeptide repeats